MAPQSDAFNNLSRTWALLIFVLSALVFIPFAYVGREDQGLVAYFSCAVVITILRASWRLRRMVWFWPLMVIMTTVHAYAVWRIGFAKLGFPAIILVPLGIIDFVAWFYVIWSLSNARRGKAS